MFDYVRVGSGQRSTLDVVPLELPTSVFETVSLTGISASLGWLGQQALESSLPLPMLSMVGIELGPSRFMARALPTEPSQLDSF